MCMCVVCECVYLRVDVCTCVSFATNCYVYLRVCTVGKRQTVLFSATQTRNVDDLARISLKKTPLYVGVDDHRDTATVEGLEQVSE